MTTSGLSNDFAEWILRIVMAGILNSKERIMDFVVTQEGKRQAGIGELKFKYATFTDLHTFYELSGSLADPELADDASSRIFFEAGNRYQDVIVPELEAGFSLRPFRTSQLEVGGGTIASGTFRTGISQSPNVLSASDLGPAVTTMLDGITDNFTDQRIIGTIDEFSLHQEIVVAPLTGTFDITNETHYLRGNHKGEAVLDKIPSIFSDRRFSDFANFLYLPPVSTPRPGMMGGDLMGYYPRLNEQKILSLGELMLSLKGKDMQQFTFSKTSRSNNIIVQFFEQDLGGVEKLSVIDFGSFDDDEPRSPGKRVLFVGKIQRDSRGSETFLCLFTVVID